VDPASVVSSVAASTSPYLARDVVRFSLTVANAGNAHASHRRHVLKKKKKKRYHFRPLPRAGWRTDSSVLPLPGAAHSRTAGSALFSESGTFSHQYSVRTGRRSPVSFAASMRSLQSKSSKCMTLVTPKSYAFIQLCSCNICDYLSHIVTYVVYGSFHSDSVLRVGE